MVTRKKTEKVLVPISNELVNIFDELSKKVNISRDVLIHSALIQFIKIFDIIQDLRILKPGGLLSSYLALIILSKSGFKFNDPNYSKSTDYRVLGEAIANTIKPLLNDYINIDLLEFTKTLAESININVKVLNGVNDNNKMTLILAKSYAGEDKSDSLERSKELICGFLETLGYKLSNNYISSQILRLEFTKE